MTLEEFTIRRKEELVAFLKARFGRRWRCIAARQVNMHPRAIERWKAARPISLYRQIHKLETWARSLGFQSATDSEVHAALRADQQFKENAAQEIQKARSLSENTRSEASEAFDSHQLEAKIAEAMNRLV